MMSAFSFCCKIFLSMLVFVVAHFHVHPQGSIGFIDEMLAYSDNGSTFYKDERCHDNPVPKARAFAWEKL